MFPDIYMEPSVFQFVPLVLPSGHHKELGPVFSLQISMILHVYLEFFATLWWLSGRKTPVSLEAASVKLLWMEREYSFQANAFDTKHAEQMIRSKAKLKF